MSFINDHYIWFKALHYIGFVTWMAGLFYLPRLFVYHSENKDNPAFTSIIKIQERKLYKGIQTPAMALSLITGLCMLIANKGLLAQPYFHVKLSLAVLLLIYHFDTSRYLKQLQNDSCKRSGRFFRLYNEIPTLLFITIIINFALAGVL